MTIGEIHKVGQHIGQNYIPVIAEKMVQTFINNRKIKVKEYLSEQNLPKEEMKKYNNVLKNLEQAENLEYYKVLVNTVQESLYKSFESIADETNIKLINAEYFGFTGRLRR